ncbi:MAG: peptide chain release factor N(5)-glutamine methyltransferase [Lachnospiraceae bacterium]
MTCAELIQWGKVQLENAGICNASTDAWILFEFVTGMNRTAYYMEPNLQLSEEAQHSYREKIEIRATRIPLQHITMEQEFMGLSFRVSPDVLIPRQDTEILVETALERVENSMRILDLCTGSGCIIISVLKHATAFDLSGEGADISWPALEVAMNNARDLEVDVRFTKSDLFQDLEGKYDIILSNPPYIRSDEIPQLMEEVRCHEPLIALDGMKDGLDFYRKIVKESRNFLNTKGWLIFEIGHKQGKDVSMLMKESGYTDVHVIQDLAGLDRVVTGRI